MPRRDTRRGTAAVRPPDPADVFATFLALLARLSAAGPTAPANRRRGTARPTGR